MPAPDRVLRLADAFHENLTALHSGLYNETQARREFIDPLFQALGWDVDNRRGLPLDQREVIHEDSIRVGDRLKAPDYSFRVGGGRKFFVEAKQPAVNLAERAGPAFQLRRYGWSASLPLNVLTDFEEFAVYDCRSEPTQFDLPNVARVHYLKYTDYPSRWDEIAVLFSREAVLAGALDRHADSLKTRKGVATVDRAFLRDIEAWRDLLARDIARRNPGLAQPDLNYAVQMTIDRIIFLRIAEDRGLERYERLLDTTKGSNIYHQLVSLFHQADQRYNSGLFHFAAEKGRERPDDLTPDLSIGDEPLRQIITRLYYPESPYAFTVLPVEILGQVYEQFLGKVITLTDDRQASVEEKPEVRKAGGVYYTPAYIVAYIVQHTLGPLLADNTPADFTRPAAPATLRVLDPACGSGSFLLGAYQYLLDWYHDQYAAEPTKHKSRVRQTDGGAWRLTLAERRRILLDHLYGVDIDSQAVEVTKLSLLLKLLEGETDQSVAAQLTMFQERALPDLAANIQCGNSLVGPDYLAGRPFDPDEARRVNPFDWPAAFPAVFHGDTPGFDAVIGNPPYIRIQTMKEWAPLEVELYKQVYRAASKGNYDIYVVFVERGLSLLNAHGRLGFILPHKFFNSQYGQPLRQLIAEGQYLSHVVHFGDQQVFDGATTYTALLFLSKSAVSEFQLVTVDDLAAWRRDRQYAMGLVPASTVSSADWNFAVGGTAGLFNRLTSMPSKLRNMADRIAQGIRTSSNEIYVLDLLQDHDDLITAKSKVIDEPVTLERATVAQFLQGREIKPYRIQSSGKVVIIPYALEAGRPKLIGESGMRAQFPHTHAYLAQNRTMLEEREHGRMRGPNWYAYIYPKNIEVMRAPKILIPDIANRASFALDEGGNYAFTSGYGITLANKVPESPKYVLGLLNSRVLDFYLKQVSTTLRGGFFRYFTQFVEQLPIRTIDFASPADVARHDQMVTLVERMLDLHRRLATARTPTDRALLDRAIAATDKEIDRLVYELYDLTTDEIALVEGASR